MKCLVIIPTYNEKDNIPVIAGQVLARDPAIELLVIDDNSPDGTGRILDEMAARDRRVHVIHRPGKMGLGTAYVTGFKWALAHQYELVCEMDADFSHPPATINVFLDRIKDHDLVIGSRYIAGINVVNWPLKRLLLSYFANIYARIITGVPVRDLTAGFKCYRRTVLEAINLDRIKSNGYAFQIEMHFNAYYKGFKLLEVPIIFEERRMGQSKMNKKIVYEAVWMVWRLQWLRLMKKL
ncbi:MAG: polyprenol monophosphomannose synthase [Candidatus Edwardsbacteria bacterium]|jgi:dolichol-phosphate mannosyltransferase|nr:polyprenol monophosphomannose synthase [Candidatus Edwardsbacteria bacterium]